MKSQDAAPQKIEEEGSMTTVPENEPETNKIAEKEPETDQTEVKAVTNENETEAKEAETVEKEAETAEAEVVEKEAEVAEVAAAVPSENEVYLISRHLVTQIIDAAVHEVEVGKICFWVLSRGLILTYFVFKSIKLCQLKI